MNIQLGDEVRLRSTQDTHPFSFAPDKNSWLRVTRKTERGWHASSMTPKNPLIMTIMDLPPYLFKESDVIEHRTGPFWIRLLYILMGTATMQKS